MNPNRIFAYDEQVLIGIYNPGSGRAALISELETMRGYLDADETDLRELTDSALNKLATMSDAEFEAIDFVPDIFDDDESKLLVN